jgi:hypothetical protein
MRILDEFVLRRAQSFALEQLVIVQCGSADLRWALAALALRSLSAAWTSSRRHLITLARNAARRIRHKACFTDSFAPAATTVAAGGH